MDTLSPDDLQMLTFVVKRAELAQAAVNAVAEHLHAKYQIAAPDQLTADGRIVRATKANV